MTKTLSELVEKTLNKMIDNHLNHCEKFGCTEALSIEPLMKSLMKDMQAWSEENAVMMMPCKEHHNKSHPVICQETIPLEKFKEKQ